MPPPTGPTAPSQTLRIVRIGKSSATAMAGSVGFAIMGIQQRPPVAAWLYWTLYGIWVGLVMGVIFFTRLSVTPKSRPEYVCLFVVSEICCVAVLITASASASRDILKSLETWTPLITVLCAGAPSLAFDGYNPQHNGRDEEQNIY